MTGGIALAPYAGEAALTDPEQAGEWAVALGTIAAAPQVEPWCWYIARRDGVLVGTGGFKAPCDRDGVVEIAYLTLIPARGTGVATAVAAELIHIAREGGATLIRAHTLPATNESTAVLTANGFACLGQVDDPEDGPVWRWERGS